jgi:hypothetical protein
MYPDVITPRSFPDKLEQVDYDPFGLMPKAFPARPYVFATPARLAITRRLVLQKGWPAQALALLLERACEPCEFPADPPPAPHPLAQKTATHALRNAYASLLTVDPACRDRALDALRRLARAYPAWPVRAGLGRLGIEDNQEGFFIHTLASAYDCLAAGPLTGDDDRLFRALLEATRAASDASSHAYCGNHNLGGMRGRMAAAVALGDRQGIHDTLYGCTRNGQWRYGLIHQLRHDFLADGLHWERTPGYHYFTLYLVVEFADMLENLGVDLWHAELPPLQQDDGHDLHRSYGPAKGFKTIRAAFDAPLFLAFRNGDLSMLGDSRLANLRGTWSWSTLYDSAYEAYKSPCYAWLLNRIEREYPQEKRPLPGLPMPFQNVWVADLALARMRRARYPEGRLEWSRDAAVSITGRHTHGCTLFPDYGAAVLRAAPEKAAAPEAFLFWGPHSAGHQSPGALHVDFCGGGRTATDAPRMDARGYSDPLYLTWARTTIAHNTVTVDRQPMFPYDFETGSIWECDRWRDTISDGELALFQPDGKGFKAVRAKNRTVYKDVTLDRTLAVTAAFILDVFRVTADRVRTFDWAMHVAGTPAWPAGTRAARFGDERGYRHFTDVKRLPAAGSALDLAWTRPGGLTRVSAVLPPRGSAWTACDPLPPADKSHTLGEIGPVEPRHALILRTQGKSALFVSAWSFNGKPVALRLRSGNAGTDVRLQTGDGAGRRQWTFPIDGPVV